MLGTFSWLSIDEKLDISFTKILDEFKFLHLNLKNTKNLKCILKELLY